MLLLTSGTAFAADVAQWTFGDGQVAGAAAAPGAKIPSGSAIAAGAAAPALINLANGAQGTIVLAPGAVVSLAQANLSGHNVLELTITGGAAQVDLLNKGPYEQVLVQSGALQIAVTGTLFLIEHAKNDSNYCALVRGHIKARNAAIANATNSWIDLNSHQGIGTTDAGLSPVDSLAMRPQIFAPNGQPLGLREQIAATGTAATAAASWHSDAATGAIILSAMHQNPAFAAAIIATNIGGGAEGVTAIGQTQEGPADRAIEAVAQNDPNDLATFIKALSSDDAQHCGEHLTAAIVALPAQAAVLTAAAVAGSPSQAVDLVVAAVVTDTKDAQSIVNAACQQAPDQTDTIVNAAKTLEPSVVVPPAAAPKVAVAPAPAPATAPASGGNGGNGGFSLPASSEKPSSEPAAPTPTDTTAAETTPSPGAGGAPADPVAGLVTTAPTFGPGSSNGGVPTGASVGPTTVSGAASFTSPTTAPVSGE